MSMGVNVFWDIVGRVLPDTVECSLIPFDSVLPSRVSVSSEVMAALLFLALDGPKKVITPEKLIMVFQEMKTVLQRPGQG